MDEARLNHLLDGYAEARLSDEEARDLSAELKRSPEARRRFWEAAHQHVMLSELVAEGAGRQLARAETLPFRPRRWARWAWASAAGLLLALATAWMLAPVSPPSEGTDAFAILADLAGDVRLLVGDSMTKAVPGQKILPGNEIQTREGTVVVAYADRSRVELAQDTSVRLMGEEGDGRKSIYLLKGAVNANVAPQPEGRPLMVRTEQGDLQAPSGRFSSAALMGETRIEMEDGRATLSTPGAAHGVDLELGTFAVIALPRPEVYRSAPLLPRSTPSQVIDEPSGPVTALAVSPDGRTLAIPAWKGPIRLWDRKGKAFTGVLSGQGTRAHALAFSRDGRMLAAGHDAAKKGMPGLMVWDMRQMTPRQGIATVRRVHALGWTPDNLTLAYAPNGKGGGVHVLDLGDSRERLRLGEGEQVMALAISPDGKTVVQGLRDGRVTMHDMATGRPVRTFRGHRRHVQAVAFHPRGKLLASGSRDGTVRLWDARTGQLVRVLAGKFGEARCLAFSPGGRTLASGHGGTVVLWDVASGQQQTTLKAHKFSVTAIAYLPNGQTLATAGWDRTVKLWELKPTPVTVE